jgi:hypothetical protein
LSDHHTDEWPAGEREDPEGLAVYLEATDRLRGEMRG